MTATKNIVISTQTDAAISIKKQKQNYIYLQLNDQIKNKFALISLIVIIQCQNIYFTKQSKQTEVVGQFKFKIHSKLLNAILKGGNRKPLQIGRLTAGATDERSDVHTSRCLVS